MSLLLPLVLVIFPGWWEVNHQSLVCHSEQCSCIAQHSQTNCQMLTWINTVTRAMLRWTPSQIPHPAWRVSALMDAQFIAVHVTKMLCSWLRRACILWWNWNIIYRMWCGMVWQQLVWMFL